MYLWQWARLYEYLLPILTGLCLLMFVCRALMLWQKDLTPRMAWYASMYFSLFVLFLFRSLDSDVSLIAVTYLLLGVALVMCNYYEWGDFVIFLRKKNARFLGIPDPDKDGVHTLEALTTDRDRISIEATVQSKPATAASNALAKKDSEG